MATQIKRPNRATIRTVFQTVIALATLLPTLVTGLYGGDSTAVPAAVAQVLVVAGVITRVMALPSVEEFLQKYVPWLAADPDVSPTA